MNRTIRLLEQRVERAVSLLKQLGEERGRLDAEVRSLRHKVDALERELATARGGSDGGWKRERESIVAAVRSTVAELRGD